MRVDELLAKNDITLKDTAPGRHYATCPQCSKSRKRPHQSAKVLGVTINSDGTVHWGCNHCGWKGPEKGASPSNGKIQRSYDYTDADGKLLFQKVRNPPGRQPRFWCRQPDGRGDWVKGLEGVDERPLYRWPEIIEAMALDREIAIVEGEKDADTLWAIGVPATCNFDGAAEPNVKPKWRPAYSEQLRGASIVVFNDNDPQGIAHADAVCRMSVGIAARVRWLDLALHWPNMPKGKDVSDWLDQGHTREGLDALIAAAPEYVVDAKTAELPDDDPPPNEPAHTHTLGTDAPRQASGGAEQPLVYVDISKWINAQVPKRRWAVLNRIPANNVTVLSGTGGIGKTIAAMLLAVAIVLARDWFRTMPEPGPVMFLSGEEPAEEMHRRFADIVEHLGASYQDLIDGGLHLIDKAGRDAMLARPDRNGVLQTTPLFKQLLADACRLRPRLVILDNRNRVYGGNINDPTQVSDFINALHGLAIDADTAVLLILHPSMTGIAAASDSSHSGLAGAMTWHDLPRGRMYFEKLKTHDDREIDKNLRLLVCKKNNYGPDDETVTLRWKTGTNGSGVFVTEAAPDSLEALAANQKAEELFLTLLQRLSAQNRGPFSSKQQSNNYAPKMLAATPEAKDAGIKKAALAKAMERLLDAEKITSEPYGSPSRKLTMLVTTKEPT
jgi:RecA-family ATPase